MNIPNPTRPVYPIADAGRTAAEGIREQIDRLQRNVAEVARPERSDNFATGSRERALVEQREIEHAVKANAKALQVAGETLGTIIDIKV